MMQRSRTRLDFNELKRNPMDDAANACMCHWQQLKVRFGDYQLLETSHLIECNIELKHFGANINFNLLNIMRINAIL